LPGSIPNVWLHCVPDVKVVETAIIKPYMLGVAEVTQIDFH